MKKWNISSAVIKTILATAILVTLASSKTLWIAFGDPPAQPPRKGVAVAGFQRDFEPGTPRPQWRYLWNATGEIGKTNGYRDLVWNGASYGSDADSTFPRPGPAGYVKILRGSGHPGRGKKQGATFDRYAIAGFTVTRDGYYLITNSFIFRMDGDLLGSINLRVFVNEQEIGDELRSQTKLRRAFDRGLGWLRKDDAIFVAIGPDGNDFNDHCRFDFTIWASDIADQ